MGWLKVDSGIVRHPKFLAAAAKLSGRPLTTEPGRQAIRRCLAVWLECGTHATGYLTDGIVLETSLDAFVTDVRPRDVLEVFCAEDINLAHRLDNGYQLHDFQVYNPDAATEKVRLSFDGRYARIFKVAGFSHQIQVRDAHRCRYCGREVDFKNRTGDLGGSYDLVDPLGEAVFTNVVVCCNGCRKLKSRKQLKETDLRLLPAPNPASSGPDAINEVRLEASVLIQVAGLLATADVTTGASSGANSGVNSEKWVGASSTRVPAGARPHACGRAFVPSRSVSEEIQSQGQDQRAEDRRARPLRMTLTADARNPIRAIRRHLQRATHLLCAERADDFRDPRTGAWLEGSLVSQLKAEEAVALKATYANSDELGAIVRGVLAKREKDEAKQQRRLASRRRA